MRRSSRPARMSNARRSHPCASTVTGASTMASGWLRAPDAGMKVPMAKAPAPRCRARSVVELSTRPYSGANSQSRGSSTTVTSVAVDRAPGRMQMPPGVGDDSGVAGRYAIDDQPPEIVQREDGAEVAAGSVGVVRADGEVASGRAERRQEPRVGARVPVKRSARLAVIPFVEDERVVHPRGAEAIADLAIHRV